MDTYLGHNGQLCLVVFIGPGRHVVKITGTFFQGYRNVARCIYLPRGGWGFGNLITE